MGLEFHSTMKDLLGNEINVGDRVVHCGGRYKNLSIGKVIKVTPKTVLLETNHQSNLGCDTFKATSDQIVKLPLTTQP